MIVIHRCPYCENSRYYENYISTTCMAWVPLYIDGVPHGTNPNRTTHYCTCAVCGKDFAFETGGEHYDEEN